MEGEPDGQRKELRAGEGSPIRDAGENPKIRDDVPVMVEYPVKLFAPFVYQSFGASSPPRMMSRALAMMPLTTPGSRFGSAERAR